MRIRGFEPASKWAREDGMLTERAQGYTRAVTDALETIQSQAVLSAAIGTTAGAAYTATEQAMLNNMNTLLTQIRAALIASDIAI
jgi:hypothetical protein